MSQENEIQKSQQIVNSSLKQLNAVLTGLDPFIFMVAATLTMGFKSVETSNV